MCISTSTSNCIATQIASTLGAAGAGAVTGALVGPIGVAGGALFGASSYVVGKTVEWLCTKIFNLEDKAANQAAKTVSFIAGFFSSVAAGMLAATLAGFEIGFSAAILMGVASFIVPTAIALTFVACCISCAEPERFAVILDPHQRRQ